MNQIKKEDRNRAISMGDDFFDKRLDDVLYGYLLALTTWHPEEKVLYLTKKELNKKETRKLIYAIEGFKQVKAPAKTFLDRMKKYQEKGLVLKKGLRINGLLEETYIFPKTDGRYYLIDRKLLYVLCKTSSVGVLQTYIYLADRMRYIKEKESKELWSFSATEIAKKLGYNKKNEEAIRSVYVYLAALQNGNYIDYIRYCETINGTIFPKMRLTKVATSVEEALTPEQIKDIFKNK